MVYNEYVCFEIKLCRLKIKIVVDYLYPGQRLCLLCNSVLRFITIKVYQSKYMGSVINCKNTS